MPCGCVVLSRDGRLLYANEAFAHLSGREQSSLLSTRFQDLLSRGGAIFYETQFAPSLLLRGHLEEISFELVQPGGQRIPVFVNAKFTEAQGEQPRSIVMAIFIAKQRRMYEAELLRARKEAEQTSELVRRSSDAIIRFNPSGRIETWNNGAQHIFGYSPAECIGQPFAKLFALEDSSELDEWISALQEGREPLPEIVARDKAGRGIDVSIRLTPHMEAPGILVGFSAVIRDITHRKQAERALLQREKLASVGRLASSVAHEINNPLEAVTNLLYILQLRVQDQETREMVETAQQELARVSEITKQTLRFHKQSSSRSKVEIGLLIDSVLDLYRRRFVASGITVVPDIQACPPLVCYESELRQVLVNLVSNAFDAMRLGGLLSMRCRTVTDCLTGSRAIRITVADTGTGMDDGAFKQLFEPFFSTKGIGGVGLGLWISKDLVEKNGGRIRIRSSQRTRPTGTTAILWFPLGADPSETSLGISTNAAS